MPSCNITDDHRAMLVEVLKELLPEVPELQDVIDELNSCQPCPTAMKIEGTMTPKTSAKTGRKLSAYQVFMGECMRPQAKGGRGIPMKNCVDEWNDKKKGGQTVQATEGQVM